MSKKLDKIEANFQSLRSKINVPSHALDFIGCIGRHGRAACQHSNLMLRILNKGKNIEFALVLKFR
jgi:hypothetical protein